MALCASASSAVHRHWRCNAWRHFAADSPNGSACLHRTTPTLIQWYIAVAEKANQLAQAAAAIHQELGAFANKPAPTLKGRLQQVWAVSVYYVMLLLQRATLGRVRGLPKHSRAPLHNAVG